MDSTAQRVVAASRGARALDAFAQALDAPTPEQAMQRACKSLAQRVAAAGWTPDPSSYVKAFGIRVLEAPISQAGRLDFEPGGYVIRVQPAQSGPAARGDLNVSRTRGAQRFSIAHELGHALLMQRLADQPTHLNGLQDPQAWLIEQLCDQAATELLVPTQDFIASVAREGMDPQAVERIVAIYGVSRDVIPAPVSRPWRALSRAVVSPCGGRFGHVARKRARGSCRSGRSVPGDRRRQSVALAERRPPRCAQRTCEIGSTDAATRRGALVAHWNRADAPDARSAQPGARNPRCCWCCCQPTPPSRITRSGMPRARSTNA